MKTYSCDFNPYPHVFNPFPCVFNPYPRDSLPMLKLMIG